MPKANPRKKPAVQDDETHSSPQVEASADPLIKTVSEFAKLSPDEKNAFRHANGTVTNDPAD